MEEALRTLAMDFKVANDSKDTNGTFHDCIIFCFILLK